MANDLVVVEPSSSTLQDNDAIGHMPQALRDAVSAALEFAAASKSDCRTT